MLGFEYPLKSVPHECDLSKAPTANRAFVLFPWSNEWGESVFLYQNTIRHRANSRHPPHRHAEQIRRFAIVEAVFKLCQVALQML